MIHTLNLHIRSSKQHICLDEIGPPVPITKIYSRSIRFDLLYKPLQLYKICSWFSGVLAPLLVNRPTFLHRLCPLGGTFWSLCSFCVWTLWLSFLMTVCLISFDIMLFSKWDTPSDACFNSMCNTNSLNNYIVIMFCICVIMHYIIDSDIFHCIE